MSERHEALLEILRLANRLSRSVGSLNAERSSAGISGVNARILAYLADHEDEGVFQRDIEEQFAIRRSTVSKIEGLMEQKELVVREAVAHDARLKRLRLPDKARRIQSVAAGEFDAFEAHATAGLSAAEIETLRCLLTKIRMNLETKGS